MRRAAAVLALPALAACAGPPSDTPITTAPAGYVIEEPGRGPVLCSDYVLTSMPPRCDGVDLLGWDWADVADEQRHAGTTWVRTMVRGHCDAEGNVFVVARAQPGNRSGMVNATPCLRTEVPE